MEHANRQTERHPLLARYRPASGVSDELFDTSGAMRPVWRPFVEKFLELPPAEIAQRFERGNQYLRDAGVYYRRYSNDPLTERDWPLSHIPVILHETEWGRICDGLAQRADLLEAVMADLYGPGQLVIVNTFIQGGAWRNRGGIKQKIAPARLLEWSQCSKLLRVR